MSRAVAFDFDGTLSDSEMVVLLAEAAGVADRVAAVTERAMAGDLAYAESLRERVGLLEGLSVEAVEEAFDRVRLRPGVPALFGDLRGAGTSTAVLTGGFERGVAAALSNAGPDDADSGDDRGDETAAVDRVVANRLEVADGALTGGVSGPLVEGTKDDALRAWCADLGIDPADAAAVGDGANDRPMLRAAGLAVGYDPKPGVAADCDVVVDGVSELRRVLAEEGLL